LPKLALSALFVALLLPHPIASLAQSAPAPTIRYHYGDNLAWADPSFDDGSWPLASNSVWIPPKSGGFVWVRIHMAWPTATSAPLALRETQFELAPPAEEIYLNGLRLGSNGALPPHAQLWTAPPHLVFPIPDAQLPSSHQAVIAVRAWINPTVLSLDGYASTFTIADTGMQQALAREARYSLVLGQLPFVSIATLLVLLGFALLAIGIAVRRRELLLFGILLIAGPLQGVLYQLSGTRALPLSMWLFAPLMTALLCIVPVSYVEFFWYAFRLGGRRWKLALQALCVLSALALLPMMLASRLQLSARFDTISAGAGMLRDVLEASAAAWAMQTRRSQRWLAFAIFLTPAASFIALMADYFAPRRWSALADALFNDFEVTGALLIAAILVRRAWYGWRSGERLRAELEAAREVQQRLVPAQLPVLSGWSLASVYMPAAEVGGDFYQVLPQPAASTLIVVGDVSGKGLKAAMTGTLVLGALRSMAKQHLSPAQILSSLNAQLAADSDGGFVTCLCARIGADGNLILANAGQLAPYRNGEEIQLESGLPLGIAPDATYREFSICLAPNEQLTFLSDGVVEARNAGGELFGFERTATISTQSAEAIAAAAQEFGQEDDITVLTLTFSPAPNLVEASHA